MSMPCFLNSRLVSSRKRLFSASSLPGCVVYVRISKKRVLPCADDSSFDDFSSAARSHATAVRHNASATTPLPSFIHFFIVASFENPRSSATPVRPILTVLPRCRQGDGVHQGPCGALRGC